MIVRIEVDFDVPVNLPKGFEQRFVDLLIKVSENYEKENPGRKMWPAGMGAKPTADYTNFDEEIYHISVAERIDFSWPCAKCNYSAGNHADVLWGAPAKDCVYEPASKPFADWRGFYRRMMQPGTYRSKIKRQARMRRYKSRFQERLFRHSR